MKPYTSRCLETAPRPLAELRQELLDEQLTLTRRHYDLLSELLNVRSSLAAVERRLQMVDGAEMQVIGTLSGLVR